jgi:peptide deformylase
MMIVEVSQIPTVDKITDVPLDNPVVVYKTCQDLQQLCEQEKGIGVSAVQVGIPWKLFLVRGDGSCPFIPRGEFGYFVNCDYKPVEGTEQVMSLEGCLSLRTADGRLRSFQVPRHQNVRVTGQRLLVDQMKFVDVDYTLSFKEEGIVFQHEIDHHLGVLVSDIGKELFVW